MHDIWTASQNSVKKGPADAQKGNAREHVIQVRGEYLEEKEFGTEKTSQVEHTNKSSIRKSIGIDSVIRGVFIEDDLKQRGKGRYRTTFVRAYDNQQA